MNLNSLVYSRISVVVAAITICTLNLHIDYVTSKSVDVLEDKCVSQEGEWTPEQEKAYKETMATLFERVHNKKDQVDGLLISIIEMKPLLSKISDYNSDYLRLEELLDADTLALIERAVKQKQCRDRTVGIKVPRSSGSTFNNSSKIEPQLEASEDCKRSRIPSLLQLLYENDDLHRNCCPKLKNKSLEPNRTIEKRNDAITSEGMAMPTIHLAVTDQRTINSATINENSNNKNEHKEPPIEPTQKEADTDTPKDNDNNTHLPTPNQNPKSPAGNGQVPSTPSQPPTHQHAHPLRYPQPHHHIGHYHPPPPIPLLPINGPHHNHPWHLPTGPQTPRIPLPNNQPDWFPTDVKYNTPDAIPVVPTDNTDNENQIIPNCVCGSRNGDTNYWRCEWPPISNCQKTTYVSDLVTYESPCGCQTNSYYGKIHDYY